MIYSWETCAFGELLAAPVRNGIYKKKEFHGRGQKIVNMGDLFSLDFISSQEMKRIELSDKELANSLVKDGDLLFARRSLILEGSGKCSLVVRPSEDTTFESSVIRARLNPKRAIPRFYYYMFRSPQGRALVSSITTGAVVSGIRGSELVMLKVPKPPLPIQRKIAAILGNYDDLIENNTRRIKILEELACTIYREWFVEFRFPGHENVKMVESELGLIPQGWQIKKLSSLVQTQYGYTESATEDKVGPKFVRGKDVNKTSYIDWDSVPFCPINSEKYAKYRIDVKDILVIRMADPGKVAIVENDVEAVFASYLIRLNLKSNLISPYYLFYSLLDRRYQDYIYGASTGTTRKSASAGVITDFDFVIPTSEVRDSFETLIALLRKGLNNLLDKNANLRKTRDLLLPQLISGELDVSELDIKTDTIQSDLGNCATSKSKIE